ncbi:MAG: hypothetical protein IJ415_04780 [Clostridia bacterium]|nr:hypothetical protein [Clostridia bacterium]
MKKKLKFLACSLLLVFIVPCMFMLTGCGSNYTTISSKEYAKFLYASGTKYYDAHNGYSEFGNMTIASTFSVDGKYTEEVEYKENSTDTEYVVEDFTVELVATCEEIVTIYNVGEGADAELYIQITENSNSVTKGYRAAEETETLEAYTETIIENTTHTFVKDGEEYRYYSVTTEKVDDEEETVEKTYYTYETSDAYEEAISEFLYEIEVMLIGLFYPDSNAVLEISFCDSTYYKDGDKFGATLEFANTSFDAGLGDYTYGKVDTTFVNSLPNQAKLTMEYAVEGEEVSQTSESNISYTAKAVSKPADTTGYELITDAPDVSFYGMGIGGQ